MYLLRRLVFSQSFEGGLPHETVGAPFGELTASSSGSKWMPWELGYIAEKSPKIKFSDIRERA